MECYYSMQRLFTHSNMHINLTMIQNWSLQSCASLKNVLPWSAFWIDGPAMATAPPLLTVSKLEVSVNTPELWISEGEPMKKEKGPLWDWVVDRQSLDALGGGELSWEPPILLAADWRWQARQGEAGVETQCPTHLYIFSVASHWIYSCLTTKPFWHGPSTEFQVPLCTGDNDLR